MGLLIIMKRLTYVTILLLVSASLFAKDGETDLMYRRSSLYSILVNNEDQKFASDIRTQFMKIPVPEKYNDHSLSVHAVSVNGTGNHNADIDAFIVRNHIASRMVAKWFNRNPKTGVCNMDLIKARGLYNASEFDKEMASHSVRGSAMLADAGEDLISNTFLLVNEVHYIDKNQGAKVAGGVLAVLGFIGGVVASAVTKDDKWIGVGAASGVAAGAIAATYKGFRVIITTRLYQLQWDEETANTFYKMHYTETPDETKRLAFERDRNMFKLKYIGKVNSSGSDVSFLGINERHPEVMVRKACQRAIDDNVADLQHAYEQFRVKSPILTVSPDLTVPIGKKEGISRQTTFEVLEAREQDGKVRYVKVGTVKPNPAKIWDNRFMAKEEGAEGADLGSTSFVIVSGKNLYPGMLLREI